MSPLSSGLNIRHRSRAIAVAIVQTRLPLANHGEGEIPTGTTIEGLVDPEHPKGPEQSRDPKRAGVDRLEPDIAHETKTAGFRAESSPATNMTGVSGYPDRSAILLKPVVLNVLNTAAPGAHCAISSPPEMLWPTTKPSPSAPMPSGFVQSMTRRPDKSPRPRTAASVAGQGVARTIASASAAATAGVAAGKSRYLASAGLAPRTAPDGRVSTSPVPTIRRRCQHR